MLASDILSKAYRLTNKNSSTFLDGNSTNILAELNTCYGHRMTKILGVRQDHNHLVEELYTDLISTNALTVGDIGYNGEYPFDSTIMRPIRMEVSYDGLTWNLCRIYDITENQNSEHDADAINDAFSTDKPYVRYERDSFFIRPLKRTAGNITAGIHVWWEERQTSLATDTSPAFEANLHDLLAYDLAKLETIMHPDKYSVDWRNDFNLEHQKLEAIFNDYYKNQFKRNFVMRSNNNSYK